MTKQGIIDAGFLIVGSKNVSRADVVVGDTIGDADGVFVFYNDADEVRE